MLHEVIADLVIRNDQLNLIVGWLLGLYMKHKLPIPAEVAWMLKSMGYSLFEDAKRPE